MDEEPGKVIDGTARARHWRSSGDNARDEKDAGGRSDAPKGIASSLIVPTEMVGATATTPTSDGAFRSDELDAEALLLEQGNGAANGGTPNGGHRNVFEAPNAAVAEEAAAGARQMALALRHRLGGVSEALRRGFRIPRPRALLRLGAARAVVAGLALALAAVAIVELTGQGYTVAPGSSVGAAQVAQLAGVGHSSLLSIWAGPFADSRVGRRTAAGSPKPRARSATRREAGAHGAAHRAPRFRQTTSSYTPPPSTQSTATQTPPPAPAPTQPSEPVNQQSSSATSASAPGGSRSSSTTQPTQPGPNGVLTCISNCG